MIYIYIHTFFFLWYFRDPQPLHELQRFLICVKSEKVPRHAEVSPLVKSAFGRTRLEELESKTAAVLKG